MASLGVKETLNSLGVVLGQIKPGPMLGLNLCPKAKTKIDPSCEAINLKPKAQIYDPKSNPF